MTGQAQRRGRLEAARTAQRRSKVKPIHATHQVRLVNVKAIIDSRFGGIAANFARVLERSHTYMWQLLNEHRAIGEDTARYIEAKLGLPIGDLDRPGTLERTTVLVAHDGAGHTQQYHMLPILSLENLAAAPGGWRPCPTPGCSDRAFFAPIGTRTHGDLLLGDLVLVDPCVIEPQHGKLYAVRPKGHQANTGTILEARRLSGNRFEFVGLDKRDVYALEQVKVLGKVIHVVRDL